MTEFVNQPIVLPHESSFKTPTSIHYDTWNKEIKKIDPLEIYTVESGELIKFISNCWHRGVAAKSTCWRWFARASINTGANPTNKIRRQSQVYLQAIEGGW
jgi:hypothetical protein